MKKVFVLGSVLFLSLLMGVEVAADREKRRGRPRGNQEQQSQKAQKPKRNRERPKIDVRPNRKPDTKSDIKTRPHRDRDRSFQDRHHHRHHYYGHRERSHWSFGLDAGGLDVYYGPWDPIEYCYYSYYPTHRYRPPVFAPRQYYYYYYGPEHPDGCPIHNFHHYGHCEWYYEEDAAVMLFYYP